MKTTIIFSILISMTSPSLTINETPTHVTNANASQMAIQLITALRHNSPQEFIALLPSLREFHQLMDVNASLYGNYLTEAKAEFENSYEREFLNTTKASFLRIIEEGEGKGIDWSNVRYIKTEVQPTSEQKFSAAPITIVFSCNKKEYRLRIQKAICINHEWRASQFLELI